MQIAIKFKADRKIPFSALCIFLGKTTLSFSSDSCVMQDSHTTYIKCKAAKMALGSIGVKMHFKLKVLFHGSGPSAHERK